MKSDKYIVIDTDAGADDAMAILLLLSANANKNESYFNIVAITCVYGNSELSNVGQNVLKILTVANETKVTMTNKIYVIYLIIINFKTRVYFLNRFQFILVLPNL